MTEQAIVDQAMESYRLAHMIMEGKFGPAVAEAIPHLKTCIDCWDKALRSKQKADALLELGKLHQRLDDHGAAAQAYEQAQDIYRELGQKQLMAYAGVCAGLALRAQRHYDEAIAVVERALAINKDGGDLTHVARTLLILAGIHMDKEQHADALARTDVGKHRERALERTLLPVPQRAEHRERMLGDQFRVADERSQLGSRRGR
jgi:tetratricopeptide (TPR) repeat protein